MSEDRAARFLDDILATPETLARLVDDHGGASSAVHPLAALDDRLARSAAGPRRLILTGMGSSRFAALAFAGSEGTGVELASARTSVPSAETVFVGISNSGRTPEVVDAIRAHRGTSLTIGLTNHPERPVGGEADVALALSAGEEVSGIASRTYAATLAVLAFLAVHVDVAPSGADRRLDEVAAEMHAAVDAARTVRATRSAWLSGAADALDGADEIHVIGDGREIGSLEQAALMLREAPRLRAMPMDAGDWLHVGLYTMLPGGRAILFGGTPYDTEIAETVARRGGRLVVAVAGLQGAVLDDAAAVVPVPRVRGRAARAIVAAGVAELIAAELWVRAGG